jgi:hypothetical protein
LFFCVAAKHSRLDSYFQYIDQVWRRPRRELGFFVSVDSACCGATRGNASRGARVGYRSIVVSSAVDTEACSLLSHTWGHEPARRCLFRDQLD